MLLNLGLFLGSGNALAHGGPLGFVYFIPFLPNFTEFQPPNMPFSL